MTSPFAVRGMIEGFYGVYYTPPERHSLLRFLGKHGYSLYVYAPKNDRQHRARWRQPYPAGVMAQFAAAIRVAGEAGVDFCYALSPGADVCYNSVADFAAMTAKFAAFSHLGVRTFSLLLDDILPDFQHEADREHYRSYAEAHADLCNRVHRWLKDLDTACTLSMCPTDYHGVAPFSPYLHELGERLHPDIDIFYTGPQVCSSRVLASDAAAFARAARRPPLIWDNYPVNDGGMEREMHIGPIRGRDASLAGAVKGVVVNTMIQPEASKISLLTFADFFADPEGYDPESSWGRALREVAGRESAATLRLFAENSLHSCLGTPEAETLERLVWGALAALQRGEGVTGPEVRTLAEYLDALDEACYHLKYHMDNLALRNELLPWLELLEGWLWLGRHALEVLAAQEAGEPFERPLGAMNEELAKAQRHPKRVAGTALVPLADFVRAQVERGVRV
ncbi:MAG: protein O-GlcNAcase [Deinococcota bacterium]|nr:protein O-GlcNAcase [Deinococcota bacterium]